MKTVVLIVPLALVIYGGFQASLTVLNLLGLPGALISGISNKGKSSMDALRFFLRVIVSTLGQSYGYLAFVALIVNITRWAAHTGDYYNPVLWPMAFIASFAPIYLCAGAAGVEAGSEWNAQIPAIFVTEILAAIGFFIFAFFPRVIALGWPWISYISH